jgi:hypothetical protein
MKSESIVKYKKGTKFSEWINRQHGTGSTCQQPLEQSNLGIIALSSIIYRTNIVTRSETKRRQCQSGGKPDALRRADLNDLKWQRIEEHGSNTTENQEQTCLNPDRGMSTPTH